MHPAKIQISLRILTVWSESSLGAFWIAGDTKFLLADNEQSDQTVRMRMLIWVFVGCTCLKVCFLTFWLNKLLIRLCNIWYYYSARLSHARKKRYSYLVCIKWAVIHILCFAQKLPARILWSSNHISIWPWGYKTFHAQLSWARNLSC